LYREPLPQRNKMIAKDGIASMFEFLLALMTSYREEKQLSETTNFKDLQQYLSVFVEKYLQQEH
jgi:hypothetical protein